MLLERPGGPAIGSLQISVATSLFFCVCGDALRKANRRFKPYSSLLLPALFIIFFCTSRPLGWPGGTYDTCPATTDVPLHLVLFYALCGWEAPSGTLETAASLPSGKWVVLHTQTGEYPHRYFSFFQNFHFWGLGRGSKWGPPKQATKMINRKMVMVYRWKHILMQISQFWFFF